ETREYWTGPKLDAQALDGLAGIDRVSAETPSWRGWVVGLAAVCLLSYFTPHIEFYLNGSQLTINLLPTGPMILLILLLGTQWVVHRLASRLALSRQDLTLVACMSMVGASLPGYGYMIYIMGGMAGPEYFKSDDNH